MTMSITSTSNEWPSEFLPKITSHKSITESYEDWNSDDRNATITESASDSFSESDNNTLWLATETANVTTKYNATSNSNDTDIVSWWQSLSCCPLKPQKSEIHKSLLVNQRCVLMLEGMFALLGFLWLKKKQGPAGQRCVRMALKRHKGIKKA